MIKREVQSDSVRRWNEINDNSPIATSHNPMTPAIIKYIRPNNYRRLLNIKLLNESGVKSILTTPLSKQNKQNHNIDIANYRNSGISLQVCKSKLIGIYSQVYSNGKKYWYKIQRDTDEEINSVIEAKKEEIKEKIDNAMIMFCEEFKLNFRFEKPIWLRSETAIHGDDYIDRIPRSLIIHDTIFKKVYKDDLEFKSGKGEEPIVHLKNYIANRSIEKVSPEIVKGLNVIDDKLDKFVNIIDKLDKSISWLNTNLVSHEKALNGINEGIVLQNDNQRVNVQAIQDLSKGVNELREQVRKNKINDFIERFK